MVEKGQDYRETRDAQGGLDGGHRSTYHTGDAPDRLYCAQKCCLPRSLTKSGKGERRGRGGRDRAYRHENGEEVGFGTLSSESRG